MGVVVSSTSSQMELLFNVTHMETHAAPILAGVEIVSIIANVLVAKTSEGNK